MDEADWVPSLVLGVGLLPDPDGLGVGVDPAVGVDEGDGVGVAVGPPGSGVAVGVRVGVGFGFGFGLAEQLGEGLGVASCRPVAPGVGWRCCPPPLTPEVCALPPEPCGGLERRSALPVRSGSAARR